MKQIELKKEEIQKLKAEIQNLRSKVEELEEKLKAQERLVKEAQENLAQLLAARALGEKVEENQIKRARKTLEEQELALQGLQLATEEIKRRISNAEEAFQRALLEFFHLRRSKLIERLSELIEQYNQSAIQVLSHERQINQILHWLKFWEQHLQIKLQQAGLPIDEALKKIGPDLLLHQRLDNDLHYIHQRKIAPILALEHRGQISIPWDKKLSFTELIPHNLSEKNFWSTLERALGLE